MQLLGKTGLLNRYPPILKVLEVHLNLKSIKINVIEYGMDKTQGHPCIPEIFTVCKNIFWLFYVII